MNRRALLDDDGRVPTLSAAGEEAARGAPRYFTLKQEGLPNRYYCVEIEAGLGEILDSLPIRNASRIAAKVRAAIAKELEKVRRVPLSAAARVRFANAAEKTGTGVESKTGTGTESAEAEFGASPREQP